MDGVSKSVANDGSLPWSQARPFLPPAEEAVEDGAAVDAGEAEVAATLCLISKVDRDKEKKLTGPRLLL